MALNKMTRIRLRQPAGHLPCCLVVKPSGQWIPEDCLTGEQTWPAGLALTAVRS